MTLRTHSPILKLLTQEAQRARSVSSVLAYMASNSSEVPSALPGQK